MLCALVVDASGEGASDLQAETIRRIQEAKDNAAKLAQRFRAETYVATTGDTILYRFLEPEGYDPTERTLSFCACTAAPAADATT